MHLHVHHPDRKSLIIVGLIAIILGLLSLLAPTLTGLSLVLLVGTLVTAAGAARMYWAFKTRKLTNGGVLFLLGGLTFVTGVAMIVHPMIASGIITLIMIIYFLLDGMSELYAATVLRPNPGWVVMAIAGSVSILLGIMTWTHYPIAGAWAIGLFLGIKMLLIGIIVLKTHLYQVDTHRKH